MGGRKSFGKGSEEKTRTQRGCVVEEAKKTDSVEIKEHGRRNVKKVE